MTLATNPPPAPTAPFGTLFATTMTSVSWRGGEWTDPVVGPVENLSLHPATHALHYASACFEGLKAHRGVDGIVRLFRLDRHVARMRISADLLLLPAPPPDLLSGMIISTVAANRDEVPASPGSLYLRPTLLGTERNIGAAGSPSTEALLYVLASPVGDYFAGGDHALRIAVETRRPRTTPQFGRVKSGANYVMALGITQEAKREVGADQVLFAPGGDVQETGASNFLLLDEGRIVTKALDESFLHGVTRDSVLRLAADLGYAVEERDITVDEVVEWTSHGEAALAGTAAVLSGVGEVVVDGTTRRFGDGGVGANTRRLREALTAIHLGVSPDPYGWTTPV